MLAVVLMECVMVPGVLLDRHADVFRAEGALVQWARRGSRSWRQALTYLQSSLALREQHSGMDAGHAYVADAIRECVQVHPVPVFA